MPGIDEPVKTGVYYCFPKAEGGWGGKQQQLMGMNFGGHVLKMLWK